MSPPTNNARQRRTEHLVLDQHKIGITMGRNCDSLLAELFLHAYETELLHGLLKNKR
jgi:hypothetical protein